MTVETQGSDLDPANLRHHTEGGRNVVRTGQGYGGHDIFFAAVQMSRMPMILSDPHQDDCPDHLQQPGVRAAHRVFARRHHRP